MTVKTDKLAADLAALVKEKFLTGKEKCFFGLATNGELVATPNHSDITTLFHSDCVFAFDPLCSALFTGEIHEASAWEGLEADFAAFVKGFVRIQMQKR
jgi:hypothetical protein